MLNKGTCPVPASDKWGYNAPWVLFSKSLWKRGGVCCVEERFVGRLLPLVSLPLIVLPPSCLFLEMLWFDLQARGLKVHMFEQRKFLGLFTHVWFEHICLLVFLFAYVWTYLFAHAKSESETVQLSSYEDADHNVKGWWTWPPLMANNWCLPS